MDAAFCGGRGREHGYPPLPRPHSFWQSDRFNHESCLLVGNITAPNDESAVNSRCRAIPKAYSPKCVKGNSPKFVTLAHRTALVTVAVALRRRKCCRVGL